MRRLYFAIKTDYGSRRLKFKTKSYQTPFVKTTMQQDLVCGDQESLAKNFGTQKKSWFTFLWYTSGDTGFKLWIFSHVWQQGTVMLILLYVLTIWNT